MNPGKQTGQKHNALTRPTVEYRSRAAKSVKMSNISEILTKYGNDTSRRRT